MLVRDWMTRKPLTVRRTQSVAEAQRLLVKHRMRQLPVVERGRLLGIVTDRDLRAAPPEARVVGDVMSFEAQTIDANESVDAAAHMLRTWKVNALPVVRGGKLEGILTTTDILDAFVAFSGVAEPSYRLVIVPARRAKLRSVEAVLEATHAEVRWIRESGKGKAREVHARVVAPKIEDVVTALEAAGHMVSGTVTSPAVKA